MPRFAETDNGLAFIASAAARETSPEIMRAIAFFARNLEEAEAIWRGDMLGACDLLAIWEHVTNNGLTDAEFYVWGAAGNQWAQGI